MNTDTVLGTISWLGVVPFFFFFKEGDQMVCTNYCDIILLSFICEKVYFRVLEMRLLGIAAPHIQEE